MSSSVGVVTTLHLLYQDDRCPGRAAVGTHLTHAFTRTTPRICGFLCVSTEPSATTHSRISVSSEPLGLDTDTVAAQRSSSTPGLRCSHIIPLSTLGPVNRSAPGDNKGLPRASLPVGVVPKQYGLRFLCYRAVEGRCLTGLRECPTPCQGFRVDTLSHWELQICPSDEIP